MTKIEAGQRGPTVLIIILKCTHFDIPLAGLNPVYLGSDLKISIANDPKPINSA